MNSSQSTIEWELREQLTRSKKKLKLSVVCMSQQRGLPWQYRFHQKQFRPKSNTYWCKYHQRIDPRVLPRNLTQTLRPPTLRPGPLDSVMKVSAPLTTSFKTTFLILWHRYGLDTDNSLQSNKSFRRNSEASKISYPQSGDVYYKEKDGVSRPRTAHSPHAEETGQPHPPHFVDDEDFEPSGSMTAKTPFELAVEKNARTGNAYEMVGSSEQFHLSQLPSGANGQVNSAFKN